MTVRQLLASTTSMELTEWRAFFKMENEPKKPDPEELGDQFKKAFGRV